MSLPKSLQERIVSEIENTYNSLAIYKNTSKERVELIEHKLKSLKMMLAKVDETHHLKCSKCNEFILIGPVQQNTRIPLCKKCAS